MNQCGLCAVFATTMDTSMKGSMIAIEIPANADFFFFFTLRILSYLASFSFNWANKFVPLCLTYTFDTWMSL